MAIGQHKPRCATGTDLKKAIFIGLDEAMTALEEAFYDLTDEQAWEFAFPDRHNITTIIMHCQENLDLYACEFQTGEPALEHDERFDIWAHCPAEARKAMTDLPPVAAMRERMRTLREAVMSGLESASEDDLLDSRRSADWWTEHDNTAADAYIRTIMHTMAHVRQIWLMRGTMGLTDQDGWPEQHWA